ncbi:MAG TPA: hypothetical protein VG962_03040 [Steroidobacteraceae bacterium]|nr:hypothetical protein [Steroidobacteraceae bacterium]
MKPYFSFGTVFSMLLLATVTSMASHAKSPDASLPAASSAGGADPYVSLMSELSGTDPAHQSDVMYDVEKNYTQAPTTLNTLRYAIALAVPGHPASNPQQAKKLLEQLLATPERMSSAELAIARTMLNVSDQWLKIDADNRRLAATVDDKVHAQANSERRMQMQAEEIARLRRALDAAQQKLDAIKDIERSISERSPSSLGTRDSNSRDPASQTQTAPAGR